MLNFLHTFLPEAIAFNIGSFVIHWYGLFLMLGIILGYIISAKLAKRIEIQEEVITSLYVNLLIWGLIGSRVYHVFNEFSFYWNNPKLIIAVWNGGLAIHGGILAGVLVIYYFVKKHNISFLKLADLYVIPLVLGQAIGRWGNYFNQELFGKPTSLAWGIPIEQHNRPPGFEEFTYFHPTFLYEFLLNVAVFVILLLVYRNKNRPIGLVLWLYFALQSGGRLLTEFIRIDPSFMIFGMRLPMLVSIIITIFGLSMIGYLYLSKPLPFDNKKE